MTSVTIQTSDILNLAVTELSAPSVQVQGVMTDVSVAPFSEISSLTLSTVSQPTNVEITSVENSQMTLLPFSGVSSLDVSVSSQPSSVSISSDVATNLTIGSPSFVSELSISSILPTNIEISQDTVVSGGSDPSLGVRVSAIETILSGMNRLPIAVSDSVSGNDTSTTINVNVLLNDTDYEGSNTLVISNWSYGGTVKLPGESITAAYGSISVSASGVATYSIDSRGRALNSGNSVTEAISYTVSDKNNATVSSSLVFTIIGTNNAPIVVADNAMVIKNKVASGNVLINDSDPEGTSLSVTSIVVNGSTYNTPATVNLSGVAVITMASNGSWTATPSTDYTGEIPLVYYNATDSVNTTQGSLYLAIALGAVPALSDPVKSAITGSVATYNVYSDSDLDAVPWALLTAGNVVNIHYKATPYKRKFGIRGSGTYQNPIHINGVTDASGNRPVLDFNGAITCSSCNPGGVNNIFSSTLEYGESLAGIMIKRGVNDAYDYKPSHIKITNLEIRGTTSGNTYTTMTGATATYGVAAGIYLQASRYVTIENNIITDNGNGVFTMAKDELLSQAAEFTVLRNNRIYGNGVAGSYYEHNVYMQCNQPLTEGNYFGQVRAGSLGSTYKSRSSKDVIRFNYFDSSARIIDLVNSEDQDIDGIVKQTEYGTDYVYGNILVNDSVFPNGGAYAGVHYGGDNLGEDEASAITGIADKYRKQLYFFNNTYYVHATAGFRICLFDISLQSIKIDLWNNSFMINVPTGFMMSWTEWAGIINLRGTNNVFSTVDLLSARNDANASLVTYNALGTIANADPKPNDLTTYDFRPCTGSGLIGTATTLPAGLPTTLDDYELNVESRGRTNGMIARTSSTTIGPQDSINQTQTTATGFSAYVASGGGSGGGGGTSTITATGGVFLFGEANGTTFANNTDFTGSGASSKSRYEVQNGALQGVTGTGGYGEIIYYSGSTASYQASVAEMEYPWQGSISVAIRNAPGVSGYAFNVTPTSYTFYRGGVWQSSSSTPSGSGTQIIKIVESAGFVKCYIDNTLVINYSESTPLTSGYPSFSQASSTESTNRMLSWKDSP